VEHELLGVLLVQAVDDLFIVAGAEGHDDERLGFPSREKGRPVHARKDADVDGDLADARGVAAVGPDAATAHNRYVVFQHTLGSVVSAIAAAGLRIEFLHEHDHTLFARWPFLEPHADGIFRLPEGTPALPLMYSLLALAP